MKALQFDYRLDRYLLSKFAGKFDRSIYWNTKVSCLRFQEEPEPTLPNADWVKVKVKYGGICGSDLNLLLLRDSPAVSSFVTFPFTIGHEIVGAIADKGRGAGCLKIGDRVVIDPILSCAARGIAEPCPACRKGDFSLCAHKTDGNVSPGLLIGACHDTGGGWSAYLVAHKSQVFSLPDEVDDLNGALIEPFSCALHSVLRNLPGRGDTVLVIGGGVIGLCIIAAIRALDIDCRIVALVKHDFQARLASYYGADDITRLRKDTYIDELAKSLHAKALKPLFGSAVIQGGAKTVFECVGTKRSINDALRFSANGGKVVLLGLAGIVDGVDWTTVWLNELDVKGSFSYSTEKYKGRSMRTFEVAIDLIRRRKVDLSPLITHRFPLEDYRNALSTAAHKRRGAALKVVFEPNR
ncbi:alcohol dehydrogenase [Sporolactobacillus sp. THM7-7]|nr:alcohol dehydrogenase [Sporolactobacillus sp. THM7-7]